MSSDERRKSLKKEVIFTKTLDMDKVTTEILKEESIMLLVFLAVYNVATRVCAKWSDKVSYMKKKY